MTGRRFVLAALVAGAGCAQASTAQDDPDSRLSPAIDAPPSSAPDAFVPPPPPDAFVASPPDAAPMCTVQTVQLLLNPNVDGSPVGVSWNQIPFDPLYPLITPPPTGVTPVSPPYLVWMGGFLSAQDRLYQDVAIPVTATALELRLNRLIGTEELGGQFDIIYVTIHNTADALLTTLATWSNANSSASFVPVALTSVSPYAGQTIRISFRSTTDFSLNTNFFLDSMQLLVTACL